MRKPVLMIVAAAVLVGCSFGPTTKDEVCESYRELGESFLSANGIFDNAVFGDADTLSSVAGRYQGGDLLKNDAEALEAIADSDTTTGLELMNATQQIGKLCGQTFGFGSLFPGQK